MNDLLLVLVGVGVGAYFAESIRETVPALKPADKVADQPVAEEV